MNNSQYACPWSHEDEAAFPEDNVCAKCGGRLQIGQPVIEEPPFSVLFYHAATADCVS